MTSDIRLINILMADDDEEDCLFAKKALEKSHVANKLTFVHDGEELMDYLKQRGKYQGPKIAIRPDLILLDLNMPRKSGREALAEIKVDSNLCTIPIIVLTTSKQEEDVNKMYELGANSFICKPVSFPNMVEAMQVLTNYWFGIVKLPK